MTPLKAGLRRGRQVNSGSQRNVMSKGKLVGLGLVFGLALPVLTNVCSAASTSIVWLEAEAFEETGGWSNDPQFVDVMGSPYLLATGVGRPVKDAVAHLQTPTAAEYRLWVRCRDWLPSHSPGQFQVLVNGRASNVIFGKAENDRWQWVDGGVFPLEKGEAEVRLKDLTGWWARCDAVLLSADKEFKPSDGIYILERQRAYYHEPYQNVDVEDRHEVVVVGGGLAGSAAAIAAARHGCSVVLIQDRPVLGGNASSEIDVPPGGDCSNEPLDPHETGIIEEFYAGTDRGLDHDWSSAIEQVVRSEPNIDLRLNTRAINVTMKDASTISGVVAMDVRSGRRMLFPGGMFIDCTGDGWIGFWAGAEFRKGREAGSEFGESLAPERADSFTMGNTLMVAAFREEADARFDCPEWAYQWRSPEDFNTSALHFSTDSVPFPQGEPNTGALFRFTHGAGFFGEQPGVKRAQAEHTEPAYCLMPVPPPHYQNFEKGKGYLPRTKDGGFFQWWVELGGNHDTIYDAEHIRDELFRVNLGLWNYVKNHSPEHKDANKNRRLVWINHVPGKRESRRLIGDYILTQWDYADRVVHEDNVAYGGWGIDIHHPNGFWKDGPMYYNQYREHKVSIPFRCLYSKNISNLLMAGRNISVSHVALGGVRVMKTTCLMGQAAGTAAAICVEKGVFPRRAGEAYIKEIQQRLLKDGAYVIGQKNKDLADLALKAVVTASSIKTIPDPRHAGIASQTPLIHDLNMRRAVMFRLSADRIDRIALYLRSSNDTPTPLTLTLRPAKAFGDFSSSTDATRAQATVPPKSQGWVSLDLRQAVLPNRYYCVILPAAKGLQWDLYPVPVKDGCRAYGGPNWTLRDECYKFKVWPGDQPIVPELPVIVLSPENVIDGYSRAVNGTPHSWGPDPGKPLPQWIQLKLDKPRQFNTVHITFQTQPLSCSDYRIEVAEGGEWRPVAAGNGNRKRRIVHTFDGVVSDRIRLILEAPARDDERDSSQVCEIRLYNETGPAD
jgi:hypothetical protein